MSEKFEKAMVKANEFIDRLRSVTVPADKFKEMEDAIKGLWAQRVAYASEFPPDKDGEPDIGNIHKNIRVLKLENARLHESIAADKDLADSNLLRLEENLRLKQQLAEAVELLGELADLVDATREGEYKLDAFTTQPARAFLQKLAATQKP